MNTRLSSTKIALAALTLIVSATSASKPALAETTVTKGEGWEIFVNGRVNIFHSYARGDAYPPFRLQDPADPNSPTIHDVVGGGLGSGDAAGIPPAQPGGQGRIESTRLRSGFSSNVFGAGVRRQLGFGTTVTAYMSIWAVVESEQRRKYSPLPADVREGYLKFDGPWGTVVAGRALTLFSRGASTITFMYGHGLSVGWPGSLDVVGPAAGHIGFGVLGAGFAAGIAYATPKLAGLQLTVGYYDPAGFPGSLFERTNWGRPEAELTWDIALGNIGKIHLFANGAYQKVYQRDGTGSAAAQGVGYGGRFEAGPVRLGLAGHYGKGLGLYYALQPDPVTISIRSQELRTFDGYFAQLQLVMGKFDLGLGAGVNRVYQLPSDTVDDRDNDMNPDTDPRNDDDNPDQFDPVPTSFAKSQMGLSGVLVYHINNYLSLAGDYFRADFRWWEGEKQLVHVINTGVTMLW